MRADPLRAIGLGLNRLTTGRAFVRRVRGVFSAWGVDAGSLIRV
jgi:hypothetical protein